MIVIVIKSASDLFGLHHPQKFFVVHPAVFIKICLSNHCLDLRLTQLLTQVDHDVSAHSEVEVKLLEYKEIIFSPQLGLRYETIAIFIENFEGLSDIFLSVARSRGLGHHLKKLLEIN